MAAKIEVKLSAAQAEALVKVLEAAAKQTATVIKITDVVKAAIDEAAAA